MKLYTIFLSNLKYEAINLLCQQGFAFLEFLCLPFVCPLPRPLSAFDELAPYHSVLYKFHNWLKNIRRKKCSVSIKQCRTKETIAALLQEPSTLRGAVISLDKSLQLGLEKSLANGKSNLAFDYIYPTSSYSTFDRKSWTDLISRPT